MEVILQEDVVDVDVWTFSGVCGLIGSGFMGLVLCVAQVLPGEDHGVLEDTGDTIRTLSTCLVVLALIVVTVLLCLGEMVSAAAIAKYYGVTTKEAILSFRIVAAWVFAVVIHYCWQVSEDFRVLVSSDKHLSLSAASVHLAIRV